MKVKCKMNTCLKIALLMLALSILVISIVLSTGDSGKLSCDCAYMVIYSDMLKPGGGYYYVDINGNSITKTYKLNMQDLINFDVSEDKIMISGERKNNTLILNKGNLKPVDDFVFLNNPSYSGVTAITSTDDCVIGIMNGNFSDDTYLNFLVIQTIDGQVLEKKIIEIFSHSVIYSENHSLIAGTYLKKRDNDLKFLAEIIDYSNDDYKAYKYESYTCFWDIVDYKDSYICVAENDNEYINTIVTINKNDYKIDNEIIIPDNIDSIFVFQDSVYAVGNDGIYLIDVNNGAFFHYFDYNELISNSASVNFSYAIDNNVFIFARYKQRMKKNGTYEYGNIIKLDLKTKKCISTKIYSSKNDGLNNIFIVPASFVNSCVDF